MAVLRMRNEKYAAMGQIPCSTERISCSDYCQTLQNSELQ